MSFFVGWVVKPKPCVWFWDCTKLFKLIFWKVGNALARCPRKYSCASQANTVDQFCDLVGYFWNSKPGITKIISEHHLYKGEHLAGMESDRWKFQTYCRASSRGIQLRLVRRSCYSISVCVDRSAEYEAWTTSCFSTLRGSNLFAGLWLTMVSVRPQQRESKRPDPVPMVGIPISCAFRIAAEWNFCSNLGLQHWSCLATLISSTSELTPALEITANNWSDGEFSVSFALARTA